MNRASSAFGSSKVSHTKKQLCVLLFSTGLLLLAGCYKQPGAGQDPPKDVLLFAREQLEATRKRDFAEVERNLSSQLLKSQNVRAGLESAAAIFPAEEPKSVSLLAFVQNKKNSSTDLAFEYRYATNWLLARASILKTNNSMVAVGLFVNPCYVPVEDMLSMNWSRHGPLHYLFVAVAITDPVFILAALVLCVRTQIPKRKWLWLLFISVGWVQLTLNWHTGEWRVNPLSFQLLGSGYFAPMLYSPIIWPLYITVSFPLGAIIFLWRRHIMTGGSDLTQKRDVIGLSP